ncbi:MAG: hypothetical protein GY906_02990, partial [bacterium]|nr:hypothetical protein [bacterium]
MKWHLTICLVASMASASTAVGVDRDRLLYHAEKLDGTILLSRGADTQFNPASVVKVATTGWALERLGPEHRFRTVVGYRGVLEKSTGVLTGTLVVRGEGDPDLQLENLFLMARKLNQLGIRRVSEGLELQGVVTLGWEHGSEGRISDPRRRRMEMARRVHNAFDPRRWDRSTRNTWKGFCARRGMNVGSAPSVRIDGGATWAEASDFHEVVHHLSNPLPVVLKRFNVYSNNDIVRIADYLGGVVRLEA